MRRSIRLAASLLALTAFAASPAVALDKCKPDLTATGKTDDSMDDAMQKAIGAWRYAVAKKYEDDYAQWYYAGDNKISCKFNDAGTEYKCTATAKPCKFDMD